MEEEEEISTEEAQMVVTGYLIECESWALDVTCPQKNKMCPPSHSYFKVF